MRKIILILLISFGFSLAEFNNNGFFSARDNGGDLQRSANHLANIENLLREQNRLLQQLVNKLDPPKAVQPSKSVEYENPNPTVTPKYDKYNRDQMFRRPGESYEVVEEDDEQTKCIKECAEIYETTDKYELKDCLMDMCGFSITEIYK